MPKCSFLFLLGLTVCQIFGAGCAAQDPEAPFQSANADDIAQIETSPTPPPPIDSSLMSLSAKELCDRLHEIEVIGHRVLEESDDLYRAILAKGSEALPCLIERIDDRTKTPDPRSAPKWQHYVVGDTAVFTVLYIACQDDDERWEEMMLATLPEKSQNGWTTNGIYAYFNYVSEPKNRKTLKNWWKKWLKEKTR
jgi:hypothetical protein